MRIWRYACVAALLVVGGSPMQAQQWAQPSLGTADMLAMPSRNFYETQQIFNEYWQDKTPYKGSGWKQFKRLEWFLAPRLYPSGDMSYTEKLWDSWKSIRKETKRSANLTEDNTWTPLGPDIISNLGRPSAGLGRINAIATNSQDKNILYIGAASGGVWKSLDGGLNWSSTTDDWPTLSVSDIALHPTDENLVFVATGDPILGVMASVGVLKSTDGGNTWGETGLNWNGGATQMTYRLLIHPVNPDIMVLGASTGVYRTTDGGDTWNLSGQGLGTVRDLEFKPDDPNVIYAAAGSQFGGFTIFKSTDAGISWAQSSNGITAQGGQRGMIAVSAAQPDIVYAAFSTFGGSSAGMFRSTDAGDSWLLASNTDLFEGLGFYATTLSASPIDANEVYAGGLNLWKSFDGGFTWSRITHWSGSGNQYMHADQQTMHWTADGTLFVGNDGGIYSSTSGGTNWSELSNGLQITQYYRFGTSQSSPNIVLGGAQDNGTTRLNNSGWSYVLGGDGMECIVDHSDPNIMYASYQNGVIERSFNGGNSFSQISQGQQGAWTTPYVMHPVISSALYFGYDRVFKYDGSSMFPISQPLGGGFGGLLTSMAVGGSGQPATVYAASGNVIYRSDDEANWTNISAGLPVNNAAISSIFAHPEDPQRVWVSLSGFADGQKIYHSTNGGTSWTNISGNLPNAPFNTVVHEVGTSGALYAGSDIGVYYTNDIIGEWVRFSDGLPNIIVTEVEIQYTTKKILAATYGRGIWETDLFPQKNLSASFDSDVSAACAGANISFSDNSRLDPISWQWSFPGGDPATSTDRDPVIAYHTPGVYDIQLIVSSECCKDTLTQAEYITINAVPDQPEVLLNGSELSSSIESDAYQWFRDGNIIIGARGRTLQPEESGEYWVRVTTAEGCTATSDPFAYTAVSVGELVADRPFYIVPNPTRGIVTLKGTLETASFMSIRIFDRLGKQMFASDEVAASGAFSRRFDLSFLPAGAYYIRVQSLDGQWSIPLIRE